MQISSFYADKYADKYDNGDYIFSLLRCCALSLSKENYVMRLLSERAGHLKDVQSDYDCFVPTSLNEIKVDSDDEIDGFTFK